MRLARAHAADETNAACFHAQQGAEKALEALLVRIAGDVARTHVAAELLTEIEEAQADPPDEVRVAAIALDRYYAATRYPDAMGDADPTASFFESDALLAIAYAQRVITWVRATLEEAAPRDEEAAARDSKSPPSDG